MISKTLLIIKPDCVKRRMVGSVITAIESLGLNINRLEKKTLSVDESESLYKEHHGKWHFNRNIKHITSGPVVLLEIEGKQALEQCRNFVESFRSVHEDIIVLPKNLLHATASHDRIAHELKSVGFLEEELVAVNG